MEIAPDGSCPGIAARTTLLIMPNNDTGSHLNRRLRVLTISDMYPRALQPQFALFVEQQTQALSEYCDPIVLSPLRVFPPLNIFRTLPSPSKFRRAWAAWRQDLATTPVVETYNNLKVYRPRYNAPPKHISHGIWGLFAYPVLLPLLRQLHEEYQFDIIHAHNVAPNGLIGLMAQRWMKVPLVVSIHGIDLSHSIHWNMVSRKAIELVLRKADTVLANSRGTAAKIIEHGAAPQRVHTIYLGGNGDQPNTLLPQKARTPGDPVRLLSVARLVELKGIHFALRAVRQLLDEGFDITYTIVGEGDYRPALEQLCRDLKLTNQVNFTGAIARDVIWNHFADCDIFLLPSHWETFGIVYVEALSQGKPIVGCTTGGAADIQSFLPEAVELTSPHDVAGIVTALKKLIQDPARRERVQQTAPAMVAERFTWDRTATETVAVYKELLNRPASHFNARVVHPSG
jgi:teichuronic acid biosynthesis glycosyltransferase TuaC